jgi:Na+/proline symporter
MHELPSPLPGLLIAAIVGATMAVISAGINALATTALIDLTSNRQAEDSRRVLYARILTFAFGGLATLVALKLGRRPMVEATNQIMGLFGGPLLGVFFLGVLTARPNGTAALVGAGAGAVVGALIGFSHLLTDHPLSFLWIAPGSVSTTLITAIVVGRILPRAENVEAYVFRWRRAEENGGGTQRP